MRAVWLAALLTLSLFCGIAWYLAPLNPGVLELQFAATPQAFGAIVHTWPAEHLARYRNHLPADGLLLLSYGAFGYLLATRTHTLGALGARAHRAAAWLLPVAALCDATENALHWWLTAAPRFGVPAAYAVAAVAAGAKWLLLAAFALAVGYAVARRRAP